MMCVFWLLAMIENIKFIKFAIIKFAIIKALFNFFKNRVCHAIIHKQLSMLV